MKPWFADIDKEKAAQLGLRPVQFLAVTQPVMHAAPAHRPGSKARIALHVDERFTRIQERLVGSYTHVETAVGAVRASTTTFMNNVRQSSDRYDQLAPDERAPEDASWDCREWRRAVRAISEQHQRLIIAANECYCLLGQVRATIQRMAVCDDARDDLDDDEMDDRYDSDEVPDVLPRSKSTEARPEEASGSGKKK